MGFEVVGVEFDEAGKKEVAFHILSDSGGAFGYVGDEAIAQHQRADEDLILQHDAGIGKNGFAGHVRRSFCWLPHPVGRANGR